MSAQDITIAVVEDQAQTRDGLAVLIDGTKGYRTVGKFASMEDAIAEIEKLRPDIALCDIELPGMSGIDGVRVLKGRMPALQILMLTVFADNDHVFEAICAGASGYLLKDTPPARLVESIRELHEGGAPMSPEIARRVLNLFREIRPPEEASYQLTPHELRLLKLLVEGHSYKTAAVELKVTPSTINFHLQKIYEKLQVHSKSEAVAKAIRNRLV